MNVFWTGSLWECEQPVFRFVGLLHVLTLLSGCTNKLSAVRRFGQKAGLWARRGGVRWIKERCGKGGISRRLSWDHHQEEKCQIYRIQCSPGKQGGFDALTFKLSCIYREGRTVNDQQSGWCYSWEKKTTDFTQIPPSGVTPFFKNVSQIMSGYQLTNSLTGFVYNMRPSFSHDCFIFYFKCSST